MDSLSRTPNLRAHAAEREEHARQLEVLHQAKMRATQLAMDAAGSRIKPHKLLILVDLQGMYFGLVDWFHEHQVPIDDGLLLAAFAQLQIERTAKEVAARVVAEHQPAAHDLHHLVRSIEVEFKDGKPYLARELQVAADATYLEISMKFELFYAPVPLDEIAWHLRGAANRGSATARDQLSKIEAGVVTRERVFERNYRSYADFAKNLEQSIFHAQTQQGFFNFYVGKNGLSTFDEKEVDTRIAVRFMDALHYAEADSLCVVSSDQDFTPLHSRAQDFGVPSFQIDLSKFTQQEKVGKRLKALGPRFIQCGIDPAWPLHVLTKAVTAPDVGHYAESNFSRAEWDALMALHNRFNETQIDLVEDDRGEVSLRMSRPAARQ